MGFFDKLFNREKNKQELFPAVFEKQVRQDGIPHTAKNIAKLVNEKIDSEELARQFVLEELDAARQGNIDAINFAKNSGFSPSEYIGAMGATEWEGDKDELEMAQSVMRGFTCKLHDRDLMCELNIAIVNEIMKIWGLGKYSYYGLPLECVPKEYVTQDICLVAIQDDGRNLEFVPKEFITPKLCLAAVQNIGQALQFVPDELKTSDLCLAAIQSHKNDFTFEYVPENLKTQEICLIAIQRDGRDLYYVPEALKSAELCLIAVQNNGIALSDVPDKLKTSELCLAAVRQNGNALQRVPEELKTPELCLIAVQTDYNAFQYVPKKLYTSVLKLLENSTTGNSDTDVLYDAYSNTINAIKTNILEKPLSAASEWDIKMSFYFGTRSEFELKNVIMDKILEILELSYNNDVRNIKYLPQNDRLKTLIDESVDAIYLSMQDSVDDLKQVEKTHDDIMKLIKINTDR